MIYKITLTDTNWKTIDIYVDDEETYVRISTTIHGHLGDSKMISVDNKYNNVVVNLKNFCVADFELVEG